MLKSSLYGQPFLKTVKAITVFWCSFYPLIIENFDSGFCFTGCLICLPKAGDTYLRQCVGTPVNLGRVLVNVNLDLLFSFLSPQPVTSGIYVKPQSIPAFEGVT